MSVEKKVKEIINGTLATLEGATTKKEKDKWLNWLKGNIDIALGLGLISKEDSETYREYGLHYYDL